MILVIDNYDSFIYNIVQYIGEVYPNVEVYRNDELTVEEALAKKPSGIVISPGPGRPENAGISEELICQCEDIPLFGVCLGHQAIAHALGAEIVEAKTIMHGKASLIRHTENGLFEGLENPVKAIRYHSLVVKPDSLPKTLTITATTDDGEIMAVEGTERPLFGVQFHPESILTDRGKTLIHHFVETVKKRESNKAFQFAKVMIKKVADGQNLSSEESCKMMDAVMNGQLTQAQISAYLTALSVKGATSNEIAGSAASMFSVAHHIETDSEPLVDTCGTGGDHSGTFNISTASAFVVAGAGAHVAKHGNRSITSNSGSADVLKKLGINIEMSPETATRCIEETGFTFMFAPLYHPAMKYVMPVRREIGIPTIFNILGPIVNPARVKHHIMGVFSEELLDLIAPVFVQLGHKRSLVVHANGMDEASIEGLTHMRLIENGKITSMTLNPADYDLNGVLKNLKVENADESANMILGVLRGEDGDARKAVILNAGLALYTVFGGNLDNAFEVARKSIDSGSALQVLESSGRLSNS